MHALLTLTLANIRSYVRDRAALFWTLAFPLVFIVMFGLIFQGGGSRLTLGWVDVDNSPASAQLREGFAKQAGVTLVETSREDALDQMKVGKVDAVIVVPKGYGAALAASTAAAGGGADLDHGLHGPVSVGTRRRGLPGGRDRARRRQPGRPAAARDPRRADRPDREPERHQLLRAEHARPVDHAGRDLRRDPAGGRPREADPQAAGRDAAAALAAGRQQRADAAADRARPGGHHRGRRNGGVRGADHRQPAARGRVRDARRR